MAFKWRKTWKQLKKNRGFLVALITGAIVLVLVSIAIITGIIDARKTASIDVLVAPKSASVKINGHHYGNGFYKVEPGDFTVVITKDGFEPYEESFSLAAGETKQLAVYLTQTDGGYDWYLQHPEDDLIMTSVGDKQADATAAQMLEQYPILSILPHRDNEGTFDYTISPKFKGNELTGLTIELNTCAEYSKGIYTNEALRWLSGQGYNPSDYQIEVTDLCS
jgi:hypothetical protein